jgi:hypothetical protein
VVVVNLSVIVNFWGGVLLVKQEQISLYDKGVQDIYKPLL